MKNVGHQLPQALQSLADGRLLSLGSHEVYEDGGRDPAVSVQTASHHLALAARLAVELGQELEAAQSAIAGD